MEFKVKRSFLSIFVLNLVLVFLVCVSIPFAYNIWVFLVVFIICFGLLCLYNTSVIFASCKVEGNTLIYRTGVFKYEIDINTIQKVEKTRSYCPSLATSFDRIRIVTKKGDKHGFYYISVVDSDKLIDILQNGTAPKKEVEKEEKPVEKPKKTTSKKVSTKKNKQEIKN